MAEKKHPQPTRIQWKCCRFFWISNLFISIPVISRSNGIFVHIHVLGSTHKEFQVISDSKMQSLSICILNSISVIDWNERNIHIFTKVFEEGHGLLARTLKYRALGRPFICQNWTVYDCCSLNYLPLSLQNGIRCQIWRIQIRYKDIIHVSIISICLRFNFIS